MNRDSSEKLTQSLEIRVFICNDLLLAEKRFQRVSPEQIWTRFQFFFLLSLLTIGPTSTSTG